ncbi:MULTISPECIES: hypothetical protein [Shimia]|uniref:hypothetical protein n=1 Tax=Shimia TaxID=573139 RepID=UPI001FB4AE37|nr:MULTISPECIES: hypothetical protein [Shimia]MDV4146604.1 hypothetical protein [Shimia sp. FJ5]
MLRIFALLSTLLVVAACAVPQKEVTEAPVDLGDFKLGHNIVVAPDLTKGPLSREASKEEWIASVKGAIDARLGRYNGTRLVHLGVNVSGYVLAQPGVPILLAPKSALIITVTAWDDRAGGKFHDEPKMITVLETFTGASIVGSGLTMTAEEQMANLSHNVAKALEDWLHENRACMTESPSAEELAACWKDKKKEQDGSQ